MRAQSLTKWLAVGFFALTAVIVGALIWLASVHKVLSWPVELKSGVSFQRQFRVSATANYLIEIRFARSLEFERMKKLLDGGYVITIELLENGAPARIDHFPGYVLPSAQAPNLGFAKTWISQDIAVFKGDPGSVYTLNCTVIRPVEELNRTHPTLFVTLAPLEVLSRAVGNTLLLGAALICGLLSAVFWAVFFKSRKAGGREIKEK